MKTSEAVTEIIPALIAFQSECPSISKEGVNPQFKSKHEKIEDIRSVINPILSKHNLFASHFTEFDGGRLFVMTTVMHKSGQFLENCISIKPTQDTPQAIGSALTYGMRYGLKAILGLIIGGEDDDGHSASMKPVEVKKPVSEGFNPKNPKQLEWLQSALAHNAIPRTEAPAFIESCIGLSLDAINAKLKELKKK